MRSFLQNALVPSTPILLTKDRLFAFLKVVGYSLSLEKRYVGRKLFSRNISNMTFFSSI